MSQKDLMQFSSLIRQCDLDMQDIVTTLQTIKDQGLSTMAQVIDRQREHLINMNSLISSDAERGQLKDCFDAYNDLYTSPVYASDTVLIPNLFEKRRRSLLHDPLQKNTFDADDV